MKILLVNPPNSGRSIPEEEFGIDSLKQIFRGEPLALEVLAGNLRDQEVRILDLKVEPESLSATLTAFQPEVVGFTAMTCEAKTVLALARTVKNTCSAQVVVGGIHASNDPAFFNQPEVDFIVIGLGKKSFRELISSLENGDKEIKIPGVAATRPGEELRYTPRVYSTDDLVDDIAPAYELVEHYRPNYFLSSLNLNMGFTVTAQGCPFDCSFCCIRPLTDGRYLTHSVDSVLRDIQLLGDIPVIRLLDANTFGNIEQASRLCDALLRSGSGKQFLADVRSDTVTRHPELLAKWRKAGLRAVIVGFEEVTDEGLAGFNKKNRVAINSEAISILHDLGITIVGDFIISPDYTEEKFDRLESYIDEHAIELPMITVLTPLPGTRLFSECAANIVIKDLDYYTLTNAVLPTAMPTKRFYSRYASLLKKSHSGRGL